MFSTNNAITSNFELWDLPAEIVTETQLWTYLRDQHSVALAKIDNLTTALFNEQIGPRNQRQQREQFLKEGHEFMQRAIRAFDIRYSHVYQRSVFDTISKECMEICKLYKYDPKVVSILPYSENIEEIDLFCDWVTEFFLNYIDPETVLRLSYNDETIPEIVKGVKDTFPENEKINLLWERISKYPQATREAFDPIEDQFWNAYSHASSPEEKQSIFQKHFNLTMDWGENCCVINSFSIAYDLWEFLDLDDTAAKEAYIIAIKIFAKEAIKQKLPNAGKEILRIAEKHHPNNAGLINKTDRIEGIKIGLSELAKYSWDFNIIDLEGMTMLQFIEYRLSDIKTLQESSSEEKKAELQETADIYTHILELLPKEAKKSKNLIRPEPYKYFPAHIEKREPKLIHHLESPKAHSPHAKKLKMTPFNSIFDFH